MTKVKANGISINYEIHGKGEAIIFIAGFSADLTAWRDVVDFFKNEYQVILFDNRGAGQSDAPEVPFTIEMFAQDLIGLCDQLGINRAHFVGNSMGGFILQQLAYQFPNRVKTAIISNSTCSADYVFNLYLAAQLELIKAEAPIELIIQASLSWLYTYDFLTKPGKFNELVQEILENPYPFTILAYENQLHALKNFNSTSWAKEINVPTLVIGSDSDLIFNEVSVKFLNKQITNSKYYCFKDCAHLPMREYPEEFANVIKNFIKAH